MAAAAAPAAASWVGPAITAGGAVLGGLLGGSGGEAKQSNELQSSVSSGVATSLSTQDLAFKDLFDRLYGNSFAAAGRVEQKIPLFQGEAAELYSGGTDFLKQLTGGAGTDYQAGRLSADDPALASQLEALKSGLGSLFRDELNPAITSRSVASGGLGGGRQGVAQGVAAGQIAQQYQEGAASLLSSSQAQKDAIAADSEKNRIAGAASGLSGLSSVLGVAQSGATADLIPQTLLASILGGPTALTTSTGESTQTAESFGLTGRNDLNKLIPLFMGLNNG